jgi:small-conductance mechanosensitive channel
MARKRTDVERSARDRGEQPHEVLDRNVDELLQETRVATAGVQFLFAFLLTLPFTQRFGRLTDFQQDLYTVPLLTTTCAALVLIAPVSFHRVLFRQHEKEAVVAFADRALLLGLVLLLVGIASAVLLVLDVVLGRTAAVTACALVALLGIGLWFVVPGLRRSRSDR